MKRRDFLKRTTTGAAIVGTIPLAASTFKKEKILLNDRRNDKWHRMDTKKMDTPGRIKNTKVDVAVIGGGMAGICAAVSAARNGAKVLLVQDRPVLGGNASSEMRVGVGSGGRKLGRETGIIEEILLENKYYNPQHSYPVWDHVLYNFVERQNNLELMLNTQAIDAQMDGDKITTAVCWQSTTETVINIEAGMFIDCSGDGLLAAQAGAEYRTGREAKSEFGEPAAPEKADGWVMGDTILMITKDMGRPVPFYPPPYAIKYDPEKYKKFEKHNRGFGNLKEGFWWVEVGDDTDIIAERENVRKKLLGHFYGVWDYIKNSGNFPNAENLVLDWVGSIPGRRESRRFMGDHILTQVECDEFKHFPDAVAFGGWGFDEHCPGGIENLNAPPSFFHKRTEKRLYEIPFRSLYSRNVSNLLFAGRNVSLTHIALSSTRISGTCSTMGMAVGTASALCLKKGVTPRELAKTHIDELQENLLLNDSYIPNRPAKDKDNLAKKAELIFASSTSSGNVKLLTDGHLRDEGEDLHHWASTGLNETLQLEWKKKVRISNIIIKADSNIYKELKMLKDLSAYEKKAVSESIPPELIKSLSAEVFLKGKWVEVGSFSTNLTRKISFSFESVETTAVRIKLKDTWGAPNVKLFEIRCYG